MTQICLRKHIKPQNDLSTVIRQFPAPFSHPFAKRIWWGEPYKWQQMFVPQNISEPL